MLASCLAAAASVLLVIFLVSPNECNRRPRALLRGLCADQRQSQQPIPGLLDAVASAPDEPLVAEAPEEPSVASAPEEPSVAEAPEEPLDEYADLLTAIIGGCVVSLMLKLMLKLQSPSLKIAVAVDDRIKVDEVARLQSSFDALTEQVRLLADLLGMTQERGIRNSKVLSDAGNKLDTLTSSIKGNMTMHMNAIDRSMNKIEDEMKSFRESMEGMVSASVLKLLEYDVKVTRATNDASSALNHVANVATTIMSCFPVDHYQP